MSSSVEAIRSLRLFRYEASAALSWVSRSATFALNLR
jgi:hypothetical protein